MAIFLSGLTAVVLFLVFFVVPPAEGLGYFVRLAFLHIPAAWAGTLAFFVGAFYAVQVLRRGRAQDDALSARAISLGLFFTLAATVSGAVFSRLTWGAYWNWDPRQTTILVLLIIYAAYLTLRAALPEARRARASAVYALFSFLTVPFLVFIVPRLYFSLHPSPVLNGEGLQMDAVMLGVLVLALVDMTGIFIYLLRRGRSAS